MKKLEIVTPPGSALVEITSEVEDIVRHAGVQDGVLLLFLPHTTAGLTLNENWDPDVQHDFLLKIGELVQDDPRFRHSEGNSAAHIKASLVGNHLTLFIEDGKLQFGTWQGIYLAEFDGPRRRSVWARVTQEI